MVFRGVNNAISQAIAQVTSCPPFPPSFLTSLSFAAACAFQNHAEAAMSAVASLYEAQLCDVETVLNRLAWQDCFRRIIPVAVPTSNSRQVLARPLDLLDSLL